MSGFVSRGIATMKSYAARFVTALVVLGLFAPANADGLHDKQGRPRVGTFHASFQRHAPYSEIKTVMLRSMPYEQARVLWASLTARHHNAVPDHFYKPDDETWTVCVPKDYQPDVPHGLFVFISADDEVVPAPFIEVMARRRVIFVAAHNSGNQQDVIYRRIPLALDALYNVGTAYRIDRERIYVGGYGGGGRVASWLSMAYSDVFTGGLFLGGADCYRDVQRDDASYWPAGFPINFASRFNRARQNGRYAFVTSPADPGREHVRAVARAWREDGFRRTVCLEAPGMSGLDKLPADYLAGALRFLDRPLLDTARTQYDIARQMEADRPGDAIRAYGAAIGRGIDEQFVGEAIARYVALKQSYARDLTEVRASLDPTDPSKPTAAVERFRERWKDFGQSDIGRILAGEQVLLAHVIAPQTRAPVQSSVNVPDAPAASEEPGEAGETDAQGIAQTPAGGAPDTDKENAASAENAAQAEPTQSAPPSSSGVASAKEQYDRDNRAGQQLVDLAITYYANGMEDRVCALLVECVTKYPKTSAAIQAERKAKEWGYWPLKP